MGVNNQNAISINLLVWKPGQNVAGVSRAQLWIIWLYTCLLTGSGGEGGSGTGGEEEKRGRKGKVGDNLFTVYNPTKYFYSEIPPSIV